jgi:hypothetical protein
MFARLQLQSRAETVGDLEGEALVRTLIPEAMALWLEPD